MNHRTYMKIDLKEWVYGTIDGYRDGLSWRQAWIATYRSLGGRSDASGEKGCPMNAAETLYQYGRLRNAGMPCSDCDTSELWRQNRNGTYALLAVRLLRANPDLGNAALWREVQKVVRCEIGDKPAGSDQGSATVTLKLWRLGLIVDGGGVTANMAPTALAASLAPPGVVVLPFRLASPPVSVPEIFTPLGDPCPAPPSHGLRQHAGRDARKSCVRPRDCRLYGLCDRSSVRELLCQSR